MHNDIGQKIAKNMLVEKNALCLREASIRDYLGHRFDIYELKDWETVDEVSEALSAVFDLSNELRHVHAGLKSL